MMMFAKKDRTAELEWWHARAWMVWSVLVFGAIVALAFRYGGAAKAMTSMAQVLKSTGGLGP